MPTGRVKWFDSKKGYGFIKVENSEKDVFLHVSALEKSKLRVLKRKLQKEGFFKIIKMKSNYEKPSEKKKRIKLENLKRVKKNQRLRNRL